MNGKILVQTGIFLPVLWMAAGCTTTGVAVVGGTTSGAILAQDSRTLGTMVEDQGIEFKALLLLRDYPEVHQQTHVNVTSYNRIVLITGEAPTEALKQRVQEIISTLPNVRKIYNEVALSAPSTLISRTSDSYLTAKVKSKLAVSELVRAAKIKLVTENGTVYVMGLTSRKEAAAATDMVRTTPGVEKVVTLFEYLD